MNLLHALLTRSHDKSNLPPHGAVQGTDCFDTKSDSSGYVLIKPRADGCLPFVRGFFFVQMFNVNDAQAERIAEAVIEQLSAGKA